MTFLKIKKKVWPIKCSSVLSWHSTNSPCSAFLAPTGQTSSLEGHQSNPIPLLLFSTFFREILDNLGTGRETQPEKLVLCKSNPTFFFTLKISTIFNTLYGHQSNSICVPYYYFIYLQFSHFPEIQGHKFAPI